MNKESVLNRISNYLIISSDCLDDNGLYHGKIGIAIFFMHYARYSNEMRYNNFASVLIDEIFDDMKIDISIDFERGLSGIGWGIEYLLQRKFVDGDSIEILEDIDLKLSEYNFLKISDLSFETGVAGINCYLNMHLLQKKNDCLSSNIDYIHDLYIYASKFASDSLFDLISFVKSNKFDISLDIDQWHLGLKDGCAGYGLKLIFE